MAEYTTEVRTICESLAGLDEHAGYADVETVLDETWDKVFSFDFPLFDESYREALCKKILRHFWLREIGYETYGSWKMRLHSVMIEEMPYFNKLYQSETLEFNPLYNFEYDKNGNSEKGGVDESAEDTTSNTSNTGTIADQSSGTDTSTSVLSGGNSTTRSVTGQLVETDTDKYSDTPEGALQNVDNGTYLSSYDKKEHTSSDGRRITDAVVYSGQQDQRTDIHGSGNTRTLNTADANATHRANTVTYGSTDEYAEHVAGRQGVSGSKLLREYRDNLLNIDMMVIESLEKLFMHLW